MYDNLRQVTGDFEKTARLLNEETWLVKAMKIPNKANEELLTKLDRTIGIMPDTEKDKLAKKFSDIIPDNAQSYIREYTDQFLSVFVEILGWSWLKVRYDTYNPVFTETPDLIVQDSSNEPLVAMECKSIRKSDEDRNYFDRGVIEARAVNTSIVLDGSTENPFLRKLLDTLKRAEEQLKVKALNKYIFIHFSWDTSAFLQENQVKDLIQKCANDLKKRGIDFIAFENYKSDEPFINTSS